MADAERLLRERHAAELAALRRSGAVPAGLSLTIGLPLSDEQAQAVVVAADAFGVEPWEMAVHALAFRQDLALRRSLAAAGGTQNG